MERPVSPDAPMIITFILAMQKKLRVVMLGWKVLLYPAEEKAGAAALSYSLHVSVGELMECEVYRIFHPQ